MNLQTPEPVPPELEALISLATRALNEPVTSSALIEGFRLRC